MKSHGPFRFAPVPYVGPGAIAAGSGRIVLVEDDEEFSVLASRHLERDGYVVARFHRLAEGLSAVSSGFCEVAVFALAACPNGLPAVVAAYLRHAAMRDSGIIILTAAGSEAARISAIEWGADDAMTKPVNLTELSARIAAVLRRSGPRGARFDDGRLTVDVATRAVRLDGHPVHLGRKEFDLLAFFIRHANEVLTRQRILASVWSLPPGSATRTLDAHVKTLRRKIGRERITTVIGCGYRFEAAHEAIPGFRPGA